MARLFSPGGCDSLLDQPRDSSIFDRHLSNTFALLLCAGLFLREFVLISSSFFLFTQTYYVATSRQLKRLESVTRSPIYSHFGETLSGVSTIRAYGLLKRFITESNYRVDHNQRCYYPSLIANRWLAIRLELCGNIIVLFTALFGVMSRDSFAHSPGIIGLIMTYSLSVTSTLNWTVRMTSELETNIVSVERIDEYCNNEQEKDWTRPEGTEPVVPIEWPQQGKIDFDEYSVRYREGLTLVLNGITINVESGEKVK